MGPTPLSMEDLKAYRNQGDGAYQGQYIRFYCPVHGGDNQRSLSLNPATGHFKCFNCGAWGYIRDGQPPRRLQAQAQASPTVKRFEVDQDRALALAEQLVTMQWALAGSWGQQYVEDLRRIPLDIAQRAGIGYAAHGAWPHASRDWKWGRIVFPHTDSQGHVVNLYGRAVGAPEKVPKGERHDHLPGPKGIFNAKALLADTAFITEGPFDALSLIAAGYPDACAIFGLDGLRWEWVEATRLVFCFDQDESGEKWRQLARVARMRQKEVYFLPAAVYGGHKDLNELWIATGKIDIGDWMSPTASLTAPAAPRPPQEPDDAPMCETPDAPGQVEVQEAPPYRLVTDASELSPALESLATATILGIDTETTGLDPLVDRVRLLQIAASGQPTVIVDLGQVHALEPLQRLLAGAACKVFHNAKFDLKFLQQAGLPVSGPLFDTMLAAQLLTAGLQHTGFGLKDLAREFLDEALPKDEQTSNWGHVDLTPAQLTYAAKDAAILLPLQQILSAALDDAGLTRAAGIEFACLPTTVQMELNGFCVDRPRLERLRQQLQTTAAQAPETFRDALRAAGYAHEVNPNSQPQLLKALHAIGVNAPNTKKETLTPLAADHPVIQALLDYRKASKACDAAAELAQAIHPATGRIHAEFRQMGTDTGRYSCANPNLQNIPRGDAFRGCFAPAPGHKLVVADYSQVELRVAAQISGDERMIRAYAAGEDLHKLTASLIANKPLDEVAKEERQAAKAVGFGLLYGMGAKGLQSYARSSYGVAMTEEEATRFRQRFFEAYSGFAQWYEGVAKRRANETRTLSGRRRQWKTVPSLMQRLNTPIQGTAGDIAKLALARLPGELQGADARIVSMVHDEIIVECPEARAQDVAQILQNTMEAAGRELLSDVPVVAEVQIADSWAEK